MKRKAAFHNLGCKVNAYEMEAMQQQLEKAGYEIVPFEPGADVYVINTCTVTNIADRKSRQMLHRAKKMNPDAVVAAVGCYVQVHGEALQTDPAIDITLGTAEKELLPERLEAYFQSVEAEKSAEASAAASDALSRDGLMLSRTESHTRAFLKVQDGCDQFCSYCIIPYARGRVRSRRMADVLQETERLAASGVQEIVLTGIHLCSYGKDLPPEESLPELIRAVHSVPGIRRLRLGSLEPGSLTEDFIHTLADLPGLCPHFHLSLQSGCDRTLRRMNRHYTTEDYARACSLLRSCFDNPAITTDIIAGFPGETREDFEECLAFAERISFYETHIFPYSLREGTRAAAFPDQLTEEEKRQRCAELRRLHERKKKEYLESWIGRPVEVLFEEQTELAGKTWWVGHGREYQKVLLDASEEYANRILTVWPDRLLEDGVLVCGCGSVS